MGEFEILLRTHAVNVAVITETWCHDHNLHLQHVTGFNQNSVCRSNREGGGVTIYTDSRYKQALVFSSQTQDTEIVAVEISSETETWKHLIVGIYTPTSKQDAVEEELSKALHDLTETTSMYQAITIAGDFNQFKTIHIRKSFNLKSTVKFATRKNNRLDDILTNIPFYYKDPIEVGGIGCSDHKTIFCNLNWNIKRK